MRELTEVEVSVVSGGSRVALLGRGAAYLARVARDTAVGQAMVSGVEAAGDALASGVAALDGMRQQAISDRVARNIDTSG